MIPRERIHSLAAIAHHGRPELEKGDIILPAAPGADDGHESDLQVVLSAGLLTSLFPGETDPREGLELPALLGVHKPFPGIRGRPIRESRVEEAAVAPVK